MKGEEAYILSTAYTDEQLIGAGNVTGVKGDAESSYRAGTVNLTPANIGTYSAEQIDQKVGTSSEDLYKVIDTVGVYDGYENYFCTIDDKYAADQPILTKKVHVAQFDPDDPSFKPITVTYDARTNEFKIVADSVIANTPDPILDGDLMQTKLAKNIPNGTYVIDGLQATAEVQNTYYNIKIMGATAADPTTEVEIFNTSYSNPSTFTIDNTYDYNWVKFTINGNFFYHFGNEKIFNIVIRPNTSSSKNINERISEFESRPLVPKYDAAFTDHQYTFSQSTDVDGAIHVVEEWNWPRDLYPDEHRDNTRTVDVKPKGWDNLQKIMQYSTMSSPSADMVGKVVQFVGTTDANYTNGYFYKCEHNPDGPTPGEYEGPDGNIYPYKLYIPNSGTGGGSYTFWSMYPFVASEEHTGTSGGSKLYFLMTGAKHSAPDATVKCIANFSTSSNSKTVSMSDMYPHSTSLYSIDTSTFKGYYGNNQNYPYNWGVNSLATEIISLDVEVFDTDAEAYAYAFAEPYVWTRVDVQPAPEPPTPYVLPVATDSTLGGVKIGDNVNVDANGVISVATPTSIKTVNSVSIGTVTTETEIASFPFYPTSIGNGDALIINGLVSGLVAVTGLAAEITIKVKLDGTNYFTFKQTCDAGYVTIPVTCSIPMTSPAANHVATVTVTATDGSITL